MKCPLVGDANTFIRGARRDAHARTRARVEDHTTVLRMLIDRYDDLVALRTQAACRLHVALRELIAGGAPRRLGASRATELLRIIHLQGAAGLERKRLAAELLADLRRLDRDIATAKRRVSDAVTASGTSLLELHGVGPIVAGFILGHVGDPARFPTPERFASYNGTAPICGALGRRTTSAQQNRTDEKGAPRCQAGDHPSPPTTESHVVDPGARAPQELHALLAALAIALVVSLVAGAVALGQRNRASDQGRLAEGVSWPRPPMRTWTSIRSAASCSPSRRSTARAATAMTGPAAAPYPRRRRHCTRR
jgi:hypothetical protein